MNSTNVFQLSMNDWSVYLSLESIYLGPSEQNSLLALKSDHGVPYYMAE